MEVAVLRHLGNEGEEYRSLVRCDVPDRPEAIPAGSGAAGSAEEENRRAPSPDAVFTHLSRAFALDSAMVVMWGSMAYRFVRYAREKALANPYGRTRVIDLQAAVVLHFDLRTAQCKDPRSVVRLLNLTPPAEWWSQGSLPSVRSMGAILERLVGDGWRPDSTSDAVMNGCEISEDTEEMRIDRWEQIRERQNNLGIERRPLPEVVPAFIVLDGEFATLRYERSARLIELAMVVAHRKERHGRTGYELGKPFSSLVRLSQIEETQSYAWEITGIDPEAVRRAPPLPLVMAKMVAAAPWETAVLATWGPDDARIITENCVKAGIPSPLLEPPLIDLQRAFSRFYGLGRQQVSLENAAVHLGIDLGRLELHRALADTTLTYQVLDRMLMDGWTPHWRPWHKRDAEAI